MAVSAPKANGWGGARPGAGRPRKYPPKPKPRRAPKTQSLAGDPFTVEHFRAWSSRFRLKNGLQFELEEYQALFLADLFARDEHGAPEFAELWLVVPEGNGKTTFFSLVVLYTIEFQPEAWVPVAASARDQAVDLTYRIAAGFVDTALSAELLGEQLESRREHLTKTLPIGRVVRADDVAADVVRGGDAGCAGHDRLVLDVGEHRHLDGP